ncbi:TonB-dependent receptor [Paraflavisolibacter sp. H34]|uniref:TonB-dependent receptor plug domain-containing protein n=1 Tax=Huijunlia imazamoxiresistens TaxID=3127457 RepID=UPI00301B1134
MKKTLLALLLLDAFSAFSQKIEDPDRYRAFDTVTIAALRRQLYRQTPFALQQVRLAKLQEAPRPLLMHHLSRLPQLSSISSGSGINKPALRGLSFNHIQLFAQGTRLDNQTWDDRHDLGISENGFDRVEIVSGPAALLYGPNAMGGALVFSEQPPPVTEKAKGYVQNAFFGNSMGGNVAAGVRKGSEHFYYSLNGSVQVHANYVQGREGEEDKPLAFNSKYTSGALKAFVGTRSEKGFHQLTYNGYQQLLGIIEDESLELVNNPNMKEERDYEMEAPYQDVMTHVLSTEHQFALGGSALLVNAGYQFNRRKEFEPGATPKSKYLGVGLDLSTLTADVQFQTPKQRAAGLTVGVQGFYQNNGNTGSRILVPDARIGTTGSYLLGQWNTARWSFLSGLRVDRHHMELRKTPAPVADTLHPVVPRPGQQLERSFTPVSFSLGTVYHLNSSWRLKGNLANGYSAPNYAQLAAFGVHEGTYRFEVGDNRLDQERNLQADLSLQWERPGVALSLNGYWNGLRNYIYIAPTAESVGRFRIYRWRQQDARIMGAEVSLELKPRHLPWLEGFVTGGYMRGKLQEGGGDLPYTAPAKLHTGLTFKKESWGHWQQLYARVELFANSQQDRVAAFESSTPGFVLTDLFVGALPPMGKHQRWKVTAFCTNIFDIAYYNHLSLIKSIGVREPGRNLGLQWRYEW